MADGNGIDQAATPRHRAVFAVSVAAELCGLHPQTLRAYERRGLLTPARTAGGTRRYSEADLAVIRRINELSAMGLSHDGVELVLALERDNAELRARLGALAGADAPGPSR